jgi:hypothetical protein
VIRRRKILPENVNGRPCTAAFILSVAHGARNLNHGVDAMTDTDIAVTPLAGDVTRDDDDDPDPVELDRLDASLDDLRRHWGELDIVSR